MRRGIFYSWPAALLPRALAAWMLAAWMLAAGLTSIGLSSASALDGPSESPKGQSATASTAVAVEGRIGKVVQPAERERVRLRSVSDERSAIKGDAEESDAATLAFVRQYQPELASLLKYLKANRRADYDDALKEIRRVRERLENLKKRDQELHDVELALWQNSAQLRLWAASVSASGKRLDEADRHKLAELVERENQLVTQRLTLEKARTEARLEQINQQLSKRQAQSESIIAKGIKAWESRIERPNGKAKKQTPAVEDQAPKQAPSKN